MCDLLQDKIALAYEANKNSAIDIIFEEEMHYQKGQKKIQKDVQVVLKKRAMAKANRAQETAPETVTAASGNNLKIQKGLD